MRGLIADLVESLESLLPYADAEYETLNDLEFTGADGAAKEMQSLSAKLDYARKLIDSIKRGIE